MTAGAHGMSDLGPGEWTVLARVLESFTETLDLDQVLRRVVEVTREELDATRCWILSPVDPSAEFATIAYESTLPEWPGGLSAGNPIPLAGSRRLLERAAAAGGPVVSRPGDGDSDAELLRSYGVRSQLVQILTTRNGQSWGFGLHECLREREWTALERAMFAAVGRYARIAIDNALLHKLALSEAATVSAILDQIPEAAVIFDEEGRLQRMNAAAASQRALLGIYAEERRPLPQPSDLDGRPIAPSDLPSARAARGETVSGDYQIVDPSGETRVFNFRSAPVRDANGRITGSVVLSLDVTEERLIEEQERWRRRRAECFGGLALDLVRLASDFSSLDHVARRVGEALQASVSIHIYRQAADYLELVGCWSKNEASRNLQQYQLRNPPRPGEGLVGTVFHIGQPLMFAESRAGAVAGFARDEAEKALVDAAGFQSLIATPIDALGERIGVLLISTLEPGRLLKAEDLVFAQSVAERIGAAWDIWRLNRLSGEGHRAAEELARREVDARARLEAVLDSAPIGIAVVSADELRLETANEGWTAFARLYGRIGPETDLRDLRIAEVVPHLESVIVDAAEKNETRTELAVPVISGGQTSYFDRIVSPVRGRFSGIAQSVTVLTRDVTVEVKAKQEIEGLVRMMEERTARLDSILGSMTDALWVFDAEGNVVDVNRAALSMFGLGSADDAIARSSLEDFNFRHPDGRSIPAHELPHARALRGEVVPDYVSIGTHLLTGRDLDLSIAAAPIRSGGSVVGAILVIRDIAALQELDRKKDEFLSVASHELRTPLTTIRGYAQLLTQLIYDIGPEERATYLKSMLGEIDRMMGLISELLDVSRIQRKRLQVHPQEVEWVSFVRGLIEGAAVKHPERVIDFRPAEAGVRLQADPQRMRQVIDNLLSNAIKYSADVKPVRVEVRIDDSKVRTVVADEGIGIPVDELPHLFERFHRARNVSSRYYGGLGLGLYISKAIVEAHGGAIHAESTEGVGSRFEVELPLVPPTLDEE